MILKKHLTIKKLTKAFSEILIFLSCDVIAANERYVFIIQLDSTHGFYTYKQVHHLTILSRLKDIIATLNKHLVHFEILFLNMFLC